MTNYRIKVAINSEPISSHSEKYRPQSVAADIACRRAVIDLMGTDTEIGRRESGEPFITSDLQNANEIAISISHTRTTAWGLAAVAESIDD